MKKKIIPLLLLLVALHVVHTVAAAPLASIADTPALSSDTPALSSDTPAPPSDTPAPPSDTPEASSDTYMPLVENYPNFTLELLRMDYLYNLDSKVSVAFHSMKKIDWRSLFRANVAFVYAIRLNQSRFALCPGIGWSTLYYVFAGTADNSSAHGKRYPRLKKMSETRTVCKELAHKNGRTVVGTAVKIPFIDLLLRLRFNSVLDEPKAGFHTWLGVKLGLRQRASMIINYHEYSDPGASSVDRGYFNLKSYAFGLQAGAGYSRFGVTGGFHLTPLFEENQGPSHSNLLRPFSFGIYVDLI